MYYTGSEENKITMLHDLSACFQDAALYLHAHSSLNHYQII